MRWKPESRLCRSLTGPIPSNFKPNMPSKIGYPGEPTLLLKLALPTKDFFTIWKKADSDVPLLKETRMENRKLQ